MKPVIENSRHTTITMLKRKVELIPPRIGWTAGSEYDSTSKGSSSLVGEVSYRKQDKEGPDVLTIIMEFEIVELILPRLR